MNPFLLTDAYKVSHLRQYPKGTEFVYTNITPRTSRIDGVGEVVVMGIQYFIKKYLVDYFNEHFFEKPRNEVLAELKEEFDGYFGPGAVDVGIYGELHDLGYLPLVIKALHEGSLCPIGVPFMTIENTHQRFFWLTNYIETLSQTVLWNFITSATIANRFRMLLDKHAEATGASKEFVPFQGHNFSMRGMSSVESGITTDLGHLLSFVGSDTLPGRYAAKKYYDADGLISCSVPATEHAVMCAGGKESELETFRRMIVDVYPKGIVSIVSDTWDFWAVITDILPQLKDVIMSRDGKVVIRPDSGDPVKIIAGYKVLHLPIDSDRSPPELVVEHYLHPGKNQRECDAVKFADGRYFTHGGKEITENEAKGALVLLDEVFGSKVNSKGFKELDSHIGLIYGDSITYAIADRMLKRMADKGFASSNVVLGIGSYTYQYNTRDTFGVACKATWCRINGEGMSMFKDPATDSGTKRSAKGRLAVLWDSEKKRLCLQQEVDASLECQSRLKTVFYNGSMKWETFKHIRDRLGLYREKVQLRDSIALLA